MALWLLCCVLLFVTSRGYDWLSHQSWFWAPDLSLPWLLLGGIGLAIASNRSVWQLPQWGAHSDKSPSSMTSVSPARSGANQAIAATPASSLTVETASQSARQSSTAIAPKSSISFKIAAENNSSDS